jgi:hypothetical protein
VEREREINDMQLAKENVIFSIVPCQEMAMALFGSLGLTTN